MFKYKLGAVYIFTQREETSIIYQNSYDSELRCHSIAFSEVRLISFEPLLCPQFYISKQGGPSPHPLH